MKIGILTLYKSLNFGAYLQAFAMCKKLSSLSGAEVSMINPNTYTLKDWIKLIRSHYPYIMKNRIDMIMRFRKPWKFFKVSGVDDRYDVVVIGSDELWNVTNRDFEQNGYLYGEGINCDNIISYAVSARNTTPEEFLKCHDASIFDNMKSIAVRDRSTFDLVKTLTGKEPVMTLDPTFLIDFNEYISDIKVKEKDYILIYRYSVTLFTEEEKEQIRTYAKENGLKIISVGFKHPWCDKHINCTPLEFVAYVKNAHCVITSTFHGTVFSILMNTDFCVLERNNKVSNKIVDLLDKFDLSDRRCVCSERNISDILKNKIDFSKVNKIKHELCDNSVAYLNESIMNS